MHKKHTDTTHTDSEEIIMEPEEHSSLKPHERSDIEAKLKQCLGERQEYLDGWQRAKADIANMKKDQLQEREKMVRFGTRNLIERLIPVLDSFEMAFRNKETWEKVDGNWRQGVEYIYAQLKSVLESEGVQSFDPTGTAFDPQAHEILETVQMDDLSQDHVIVEVVQKGYRMHDTILRPARVKVAEYKK